MLSFVATGALGMLFWISKKYFQSDIENIEVALGFLHIIGLVLDMFRLADGRMAAVQTKSIGYTTFWHGVR